MIRGGAPVAAMLLLAACSNAGPEREGDALGRGAAALAAGQPHLARIELLNAIEARPNDPKVRLLQARTYLALGDGDAAEAELERARALAAPKDSLHHLIAHAALLEGDLPRALAEAAAAPPRFAAYAARIRGDALAAQGDVDGAKKAFAQAILAAPDDAATWSDLGRFRRSIGDIAGAVSAVDKSLALGPRDADTISLRGELARGQQGLRAALPWFDRALEVDPNNAPVVLERAATLGELGRASEMLDGTRKALALSPDHPTAYYLQAVLAARARNYDLARSLLDRAGGRVDDLPGAMLLGGALDYQAKDYERAIDRLGRLIAIQPDNAKARRLLAAAQWRSGDAKATVATLRPIADRADADAYSLSLMAMAATGDAAERYRLRAARPSAAQSEPLMAGDSGSGIAAQIAAIRAAADLEHGGDALARAKRLQADNPGTPDASLLVGDVLALQGQFAAAAGEYRKAADLAFTEPPVLRLVDALERSGQGASATQILQRFLDQNPQNVPAKLLAANRFLAARRWEQAIALYEGLRRRLGDRDAALLNNLAWAYAQGGDAARAVPLARKAWQLDPANPVTADTYGWLLLKSGGDKAEALALLSSARSANPG